MYDNARIAVDELGLDLEVEFIHDITKALQYDCLLYTSPSPRD